MDQQFDMDEIVIELGLKDLTIIQLKRKIKELSEENEKLKAELSNGGE